MVEGKKENLMSKPFSKNVFNYCYVTYVMWNKSYVYVCPYIYI